MLKHHRDLGEPQLAKAFFAGMDDILAIKIDAAGRRLD